MTKKLILQPQTVHLWRVYVPDFISAIEPLAELLNKEELTRATRFKFEIHRYRFVIARAFLRKMLALYLETPAQSIAFTKGPHGKPYLAENPLQLQFNVSHSHEMAFYAFGLQQELGADIEKMETLYNDGVAERFFSPDEYQQLSGLPEEQRNAAFYRFWAGKEAVIKALGEGFFAASKEFTIDIEKSTQQVEMLHHDKKHVFQLENVKINPEYQAAIAVAGVVNQINFWEWLPSGIQQFA